MSLPFSSAALLRAGALLMTVAVVACGDDSGSPTGDSPNDTVIDSPGVLRRYGAATKLGNGNARTYVLVDQNAGGKPLEVGIALDAAALEGLPAPMNMPGSGHADMHMYDLPMPTQNPTPFRFVELDWNPVGHEVEGVYTVPHFDFHFYHITAAERDSIVPTNPRFQQQADNLPGEAYRAPFYSTLTPPGVPTPAVPRMGVHWIDVRSPEIQALMGKPELARPFTTTFINGSWNGRFIFSEPMVTRAFILGRKTAAAAAARDSVITLPVAASYSPAGYYPAAYRVQYDAKSNEYRIALTQLTWRN